MNQAPTKINQIHTITFLYSTGGLDESSPYKKRIKILQSNQTSIKHSGGLDESSPYKKCGFDKSNPCIIIEMGTVPIIYSHSSRRRRNGKSRMYLLSERISSGYLQPILS
jgi:hypothetical protein